MTYFTPIIMTDLLNTGGVDVLCYSLDEQDFVVVETGEDVPANCVELPYREFVGKVAIRYFWQILDDDERALAESFSEKRGFFRFLEEIGLKTRYYEAFEIAACRVLHDWEDENGIRLNWDKINAV